MTRTSFALTSLALALTLAGTARAQASLADVYDFDNTNGGVPTAGVTLGSDGYFYGTTSEGGTGYRGTIYRVRPDGTGYQMLHAADFEAEGGLYGGVIQGLDGAFYGGMIGGDGYGAAPGGSVYRVTSDGQFTLLHLFAADGSEGGAVYGNLVQDASGVLYGLAAVAGTSGQGTVFSLNPDGSNFHVLHQFAGGVDGTQPMGALVIGSDGHLYGATAGGGAFFSGAVFSLARDGSNYTIVHALAPMHGDGVNPQSGLMDGHDGWFYGTTANGGKYCDCGTLFRVRPDGTWRNLRSFDGFEAGAIPLAAPTIGPNGHIYGTTSTNTGLSQNQGGAIYEVSKQGDLVGVLPMVAYQSFYAPVAPLLLGPDKLFYTTTEYSPTWYGSIVKFDPAAGLQPPVFPPVWDTVHLDNDKIRVGKETVLTWNSENAGKCLWSGGTLTGTARPNNEGASQIRPTTPGKYTYTLTCSNAGSSMSSTAVLTVLKAKD